MGGKGYVRPPLKRTDKESAAHRVGKLLRPGTSILRPAPFDASLSFAFRSSGGIETAMAGASLVKGEPRFKKLVWAWDQLSDRDRRVVKLEDLLSGCEISPDEFLSFVVPAIYRRNVDMGQLIAAVSHPQIVQAAIVSAQMDDGFKDRELLLTANGFLPTKQGASISIQNNNSVNASASAAAVSSGGSGMPSFESRAMEMGKALQEPLETQYRLPAVRPSEVIDVPCAPVPETINVQP